MSMHISVVSIEGNRLAEVAQVLEKLQYKVEKAFSVQTGKAAAIELDWNPDRNRVAKVAYSERGWTHIVDPELTLMNEDIWLEYSAQWKARVVGWVCEGASGSYGLSVFDSGRQMRAVFASEGKVVTNVGKPLVEEMGLNWADAFEDDVLAVAERLGSECDLADRDYLVLHLDESGMG